jgi:hypothetical protein
MRLERWRWAAFPAGLWAATRVAYLFLGYLSLGLVPKVQLAGGAPPLHAYPALDALCRQDCGWFYLIATRGYASVKESNFWPGLPVSARVLSLLTFIPPEFTLILIPNLACLGAYLIVYHLFSRLDGERAARWALAAWLCYPFSFFHASAYPETLMICATAGAVLLGSRGHHVLAGIALGLGTLSRHVTILMGATLPVAQLRQRGLRRFFLSPSLIGLVMPFALVGVYALYCKSRFGDPLTFWKARDMWGEMAWWGIGKVLKNVDRMPHIASFALWALLPTVGAIALLRDRRYAELAAAVLPLALVIWTMGAWGLGRYSASCWPAFLPIGGWLERRPALRLPLLLALGMAQGWYFFLHSHHYEIY